MPNSTIYLESTLIDKSGELVKFLDIVSQHKINIVEIVHKREQRTKNKIPVGIYLEVEDQTIISGLLNDLKSHDYEIIQNRDLTALETRNIIIIGHVFKTGITNLIDQIFEIEGAFVKGVEARITSFADASTVGLTIVTKNRTIMKQVMNTLEQLCH
jgi:ACT domain-containing protein